MFKLNYQWFPTKNNSRKYLILRPMLSDSSVWRPVLADTIAANTCVRLITSCKVINFTYVAVQLWVSSDVNGSILSINRWTITKSKQKREASRVSSSWSLLWDRRFGRERRWFPWWGGNLLLKPVQVRSSSHWLSLHFRIFLRLGLLCRLLLRSSGG